MKIERATQSDAMRLRHTRLRALQDAPDAFATTRSDAQTWPAAQWSDALATLATFFAVLGARAAADSVARKSEAAS